VSRRDDGSSGDAAAEMADESVETARPSPPQEPTEVEGVEVPEQGDPASSAAASSDEASVAEEADGEGDPAAALAVARQALAERTADLQRLQAEYLNYKRRVERDRDLIRENATYAVLTPIVDVLDNIDRAREHGPLDDGFKAVAEQLERVVGGLGLTKFGEPGDPFDPTLHDALSHIGEDPEVSVPTAKVVAKAGYKIGDRVVRAAQVLVVDPAVDAAE
jgi:molecular chaperone GrpE